MHLINLAAMVLVGKTVKEGREGRREGGRKGRREERRNRQRQ